MDQVAEVGIDSTLEQDFVRALSWAGWLAHYISSNHGWHDPSPTDGEHVALIHSEVSELLEAVRNHNPEVHISKPFVYAFTEAEVEGADILIRLLDMFHQKKWRLGEATMAKMRYNNRRPYRHGGKAL